MTEPPESVLEFLSGEDWGARLTRGDGRTSSFSFSSNDQLKHPDVMDGLIAAVLPSALCHGGVLRVEGPVSRMALRNLTELGEAWVSWRPDIYKPLQIEPSEVLDSFTPANTMNALTAWSGSLRSTHTLLRHHKKLLRNGHDIRGVVRVWGLHPDEMNEDADVCLLQAIRVFDDMDLPLHVVRVRAEGESLYDPLWGTQPWVVAALHYLSNECSVGLIARRWLLKSQLRYPRPEPLVPDLWSGEAMSVRVDGGSASLPQMVKDVSVYPELASLVSNCEKNPRYSDPCDRCVSCRFLSLARMSCEMEPTAKLSGMMGIMGLPLSDPRWRADAESILEGSSDWQGMRQKMLTWRLGLNRQRMLWRDTVNWLGSATGIREPWPR